MSNTNRAVIRGALDEFNRTGAPGWDLYTPNVVFKTRGDLEQSASFQGRNGLERALRGFTEAWGAMRFDLVEVLGTDDPLVAVLSIHVRGSESGVELDVEESWAVWFCEGQISRIEQYGTKQAALGAAGFAE